MVCTGTSFVFGLLRLLRCVCTHLFSKYKCTRCHCLQTTGDVTLSPSPHMLRSREEHTQLFSVCRQTSSTTDTSRRLQKYFSFVGFCRLLGKRFSKCRHLFLSSSSLLPNSSLEDEYSVALLRRPGADLGPCRSTSCSCERNDNVTDTQRS